MSNADTDWIRTKSNMSTIPFGGGGGGGGGCIKMLGMLKISILLELLECQPVRSST